MVLISKTAWGAMEILPVILKRSFSLTTACQSVYDKSYVDPDPDPKFYKDHVPKDDDTLAHSNIKAAPTDQTYSTFYDHELHKFEKMLLKKGNSATARRLVRGTFERIKTIQVEKYHAASEEEKELIEVDPLKIFHQALENSKPLLKIISVAKSGSTYRVPMPMSDKDQLFFVCKAFRTQCWLNKSKSDATLRLGDEILSAYNNEGTVVKKKQELHNEAYVNRAYVNTIFT